MINTKDKKVSIHQPNYLPWLGYFYKLYQADVFVFLDDVQYSNKGMHNYCYIKTSNGSFRLKFPVQQSLGDTILEVRSKDELGWIEKHLKTIETNYRKALHFDEVFNDYKQLIYGNYENIAEMNGNMIKFFSQKLGIETEFVYSSELNIQADKQDKIISICQALQANVYYSGTGAKAYQDESVFDAAGISLKYSIFEPFEYEQLWGEFQSNVMALDYFFNCGYNWEQVLKNQDK